MVSSIREYAWDSEADLPCPAVRPTRRRFVAAEIPVGMDTGPTAQPFHFSRAMRLLCEDVVAQCPAFRRLDLSRILFTFTQARKGVSHGLQARVTPLRFRDGRETTRRRGRDYRVQRYEVGGKEMLYLIDFCLPRYLDRGFEDKLVTLFHELYHLSPDFNGDLRRHAGRCEYHTGSQKRYDRQMAMLVRDYLCVGLNPTRYDFLRLTFDQLIGRHGEVVGYRVPRPKIIQTR